MGVILTQTAEKEGGDGKKGRKGAGRRGETLRVINQVVLPVSHSLLPFSLHF
jgi:hypothetical protein